MMLAMAARRGSSAVDGNGGTTVDDNGGVAVDVEPEGCHHLLCVIPYLHNSPHASP
ncbi:hypothetical protein Droror1_Dr00025393, partial [Drosera rotundifolia]